MNPEAKAGPYVMISVEDTGIGMSKDILDRLFEPFFSTKEVGKGTGLGLSTSLGIVQNHGGFIKVSSTPNRGSTFKVHLPALLNAKGGTPGELTREVPRGRGELILVVDDEEDVRKICQQTLESHGYRVLTAGDGAAAVALFASRQREVAGVLTDMLMPVMPGPQMIRALRSLDPAVKVIGMSGQSAEYRPLAETHGLNAGLTKPFTGHELLTVLAGVVHDGCKQEDDLRGDGR